MRESIGGTWLTGIVITFLALFAGFLTYAISYSKAFRVKNDIIKIIEQNEGYTYAANTESNAISNVLNASLDDLDKNGSAEAEIFSMIKNSGYNYSNNVECKSGTIPGTSPYGYCIEKHCADALGANDSGNVSGYTNINAKKVYYKVTTYISLSIPILNISMDIPISGETNTLYHDSTGMDNSNADHNCFK